MVFIIFLLYIASESSSELDSIGRKSGRNHDFFAYLWQLSVQNAYLYNLLIRAINCLVSWVPVNSQTSRFNSSIDKDWWGHSKKMVGEISMWVFFGGKFFAICNHRYISLKFRFYFLSYESYLLWGYVEFKILIFMLNNLLLKIGR